MSLHYTEAGNFNILSAMLVPGVSSAQDYILG